MSLLWAVPPLAVSLAALLVLVHLRGIAEATADLGLQLRRLDEVRVAVDDVRTEAARARASVESLRAP
ncbi:MAG: hypothetical protein ACT4OV_10665 [Microthrixaceae bacterium]